MSSFEFPTDLPPVQFADANPDAILARMIADWEKITGRTLYPADPERLRLCHLAYQFSVAWALLDFTGKQNLLAHATDERLEHLAAFHAVERLQEAAAGCIQRFYAEPGQAFPVAVPAGLRVTPDNALFFAVTEGGTIPASSEDTPAPFVDLAVTCLTPGETGNGFLPGQIANVVDPVPYLDSTVNVTETEGGADVEDPERLRKRTYLAPEGYSTAGPDGAYKFVTYGVSQRIADVAVLSPEPCYIEIYVLLQDGGIPGEALLEQVAAANNDRETRPQGDRVTVHPAEEVFYELDFTYFVQRDKVGQIETIQKAVTAAANDFVSWQHSRLGRDIVPDQLSSRVLAAGAKRLTVTSPEFFAVPEQAVAKCRGINAAFGGFEDE